MMAGRCCAPAGRGKGEAVFAGQHQIEHNEVDAAAFGDAHHFLAVGGGVGVVSGGAEVVGQQLADRGIVAHDGDVVGRGQGRFLTGSLARLCQAGL
nr:hypothetical protein [Azoarcus indigens]